jgi:hypothetical protein
MHIALVPSPPRPGPWPHFEGWQLPLPRANQHPPPARDTKFVALQAAYRQSGGIVRGDAMATRMSLTGRGGYVDLARRIVGGQLFSFHWHDSFWMPAFQFDPELLCQREGPRRVLDALRGSMDGWTLAHWYVKAHPALDGQRPLDLLECDLPAVLRVAHAAHLADVG